MNGFVCRHCISSDEAVSHRGSTSKHFQSLNHLTLLRVGFICLSQQRKNSVTIEVKVTSFYLSQHQKFTQFLLLQVREKTFRKRGLSSRVKLISFNEFLQFCVVRVIVGMLVTSFCFLTLPQAVIMATIASDQTLSKYKLWIMVSVLSVCKTHFCFCDKKLFTVSTLVLPFAQAQTASLYMANHFVLCTCLAQSCLANVRTVQGILSTT